MNTIAFEIIIILVLILVNGWLSMSEIAIVSSRRYRLQQRSRAGSQGATIALNLSENPGRFLSTVQIGITLVGILAGAYGGATLAEELAGFFSSWPLPWLVANSRLVSFSLVVLLITLLSLVLGELVPKQIALSNPEKIAIAISPPMRLLSKITWPLARFLSSATKLVLDMLHVRPAADLEVSEEEIRLLIEEGRMGGIIEPDEERILEQVFWLADRRVTSIMTPRRDIIWLDLNSPLEEHLSRLSSSKHSTYPVAQGNLDQLEGFIQAKDLVAGCLQQKPLELRTLLKKPVFLTENISALQVMQEFRLNRTRMVFVIDEFGGIQGLVTMTDLLEAIVGEFPTVKEEPKIMPRADGSWLLDGMLPMIEFKALFDLTSIPDGHENLYETLGGFMMTSLGRIPREGDVFEWTNLRFEVIDMDRLRVDKVLVTPLSPTP